MSLSVESNFAGRLTQRLGPGSHLTDAATGVSISAAEVPALIVGAAAGFLSTGLQPGEPVLISCGLSPHSTFAYLGAMYAGLVPIPIEERSFQSSGQSLYLKTCAKAVWLAEESQCAWIKEVGATCFKGLFPVCSSNLVGPAPRNGDDLAALMPTSGSTGAPRLVKVTHANLIANTEAIIRSQSLGNHECAMLILPISYCFGASVLHTHLYQGGAIVFDSRFMFPDKVLRAINTYGCTTFAGVPTVYAMLTKRSSLGSIPLPGLKRLLQAGGASDAATIQKMRDLVPSAQFYVMYGQTEATARISCLPPEHLDEKIGSAGLPLDNLKVCIFDEMGCELSGKQTGEIWVTGPSISPGYFKDPEETQRKFSSGWLKTGDVGCLDEDGYLWINGRKGDFMKIRGVRVGYAEVEAQVRTTAGVFECAAVSVPHAEAGEALALYLVPENGAIDLQERVRRSLPPHWTCVAIHVVATLPRTSNGKIARFMLGASS
jgi:acyl-CoA synthetase (AMP-forming)/AMP-acid ligase II